MAIGLDIAIEAALGTHGGVHVEPTVVEFGPACVSCSLRGWPLHDAVYFGP